MTPQANSESGYPQLFDVLADNFVALSAPPHQPTGAGQTDEVFKDDAFRIVFSNSHWRLESLTAGTVVDQREATEQTKLAHRAIIQTAAKRAFVFLERADGEMETPAQIRQWLVATLRRGLLSSPTETPEKAKSEDISFPQLPGALRLGQGVTLIGRDEQAGAIVLPHLQVSRRHARIERTGEGAQITDLNSFNGTFVNGTRIKKTHPLTSGDRLDIGPFGFLFTGDSLFPQSGEAIDLVAVGLTFAVPDGSGKKTVMDDISLVIRPREFVCILGPSGSGKTVLLRALAGQVPSDRGQVYVNGEALYRSYEALKRHIAVVPQHDILHEQLPLGSALDFTARLRLPEDMTRRDRKTCEEMILSTVGLAAHVATPIRRLSGGQTRRASLANEILAGPNLVFLDEVTSGLDEKTCEEMMHLFRQLTEQGRTVMCVTHNLNHIEQTCHLIIVVAPGGKLAFFGPPADARRHFGVSHLAELYARLADRPPAEWQQEYRKSEHYQKYIAGRMPAMLAPSYLRAEATRRSPIGNFRTFLRQLWILTQRNLATKRATPRWFGLLAIQCLGLAFLLVALFGDISTITLTDVERQQFQELYEQQRGQAPRIPFGAISSIETWRRQTMARSESSWVAMKKDKATLKLLVALAMCALWLGCNNASGEIVHQRKIYEKEREANLLVSSFLGSQIAVLCAVSLLQIIVLFAGVKWLTHLPGPSQQQLALLAITGCLGVLLGLAISAWSATPEASTIIVPVALIPQIMLAGAFAPLHGLTKLFADWFISLYWAFRGLISQLRFDEDARRLLLISGEMPDYPASDAYWCYVVLGLHAAVFLAIAYVGLLGQADRSPWSRLVELFRRLWPVRGKSGRP